MNIKKSIIKLLDDTKYVTAIEKQNALLQQKNDLLQEKTLLLRQNLQKERTEKEEDEETKYQKRSRNYLRPIDDMTTWLLLHYEFRYNVITDVFEYRKTTDGSHSNDERPFAIIDKYAINSIAIEVQEAGIFVQWWRRWLASTRTTPTA